MWHVLLPPCYLLAVTSKKGTSCWQQRRLLTLHENWQWQLYRASWATARLDQPPASGSEQLPHIIKLERKEGPHSLLLLNLRSLFWCASAYWQVCVSHANNFELLLANGKMTSLCLWDCSYSYSGCPKMVPKSSQNCPKLVPKSSQNCPKLVPKSSKNCPKIVQKSSQNSPKIVPKLTRNHPNNVPKSSQNRSKIVPKLSQNCPKIVPKSSQNRP